MRADQQTAAVEMLVAAGLRQSRWLRLRPRDARWVIAAGVDYLAHASRDGNEVERLRLHLSGLIRSRYGNPLVVWFLVHVVLPIAIKLLVEWWFQHKERFRGGNL